MQKAIFFIGSSEITLEFPSPNEELLPGLLWGGVEEFPSPAYWAYQVQARRLATTKLNYKLGNTLREEIAACLLGGHGIPAHVGVAAFNRLKQLGAFEEKTVDETQILNWLLEPMEIRGKKIHYRFARQKAKYISSALNKLNEEIPPTSSGRALRDWLLLLPGIGPKTASWIARNWLDADDVAILDIHILRAGFLGGFLQYNLTVEKNYLELENQFLQFSNAIGVKASELDALMWYEMMSSPKTIQDLLSTTNKASATPTKSKALPRAPKSHSHPNQATLFV